MLKKSLTIVSTVSFIHFFMLTLVGFQLKRQSTVPENIQHWLISLKYRKPKNSKVSKYIRCILSEF